MRMNLKCHKNYGYQNTYKTPKILAINFSVHSISMLEIRD